MNWRLATAHSVKKLTLCANSRTSRPALTKATKSRLKRLPTRSATWILKPRRARVVSKRPTTKSLLWRPSTRSTSSPSRPRFWNCSSNFRRRTKAKTMCLAPRTLTRSPSFLPEEKTSQTRPHCYEDGWKSGRPTTRRRRRLWTRTSVTFKLSRTPSSKSRKQLAFRRLKKLLQPLSRPRSRTSRCGTMFTFWIVRLTWLTSKTSS